MLEPMRRPPRDDLYMADPKMTPKSINKQFWQKRKAQRVFNDRVDRMEFLRTVYCNIRFIRFIRILGTYTCFTFLQIQFQVR